MLHQLRLLRQPRVRALLVPVAVNQVSRSADLFLLLALVTLLTGSVADAGLVTGAYLVGTAASRPSLGGLLDRHGAPVVLTVTALLAPLALAAALLALATAPLPVVLLAAALFGASTPPVNLAVRPAYSRAVDGDAAATARLHQLDSVVIEAVELASPLLVGLLLTAGRPYLAAAVVAATMSGSALVLARTPVLRTDRATTPPSAADRVPSPLRDRPVRRLLALVVLVSAPPAVVLTALTALSTAPGLGPSWTGTALALMATGSLVGGLTVGSLWTDLPAAARLPRLVAVAASGTVLLAAAAATGRPLLVLAAMPLVGLGLAPSVGGLMHLLSETAAPGTQGRAFAYAATCNLGAVAAGTAVTGALAQAQGPPAAFALSAVLSLAALGLARSRPAAALPAGSVPGQAGPAGADADERTLPSGPLVPHGEHAAAGSVASG